MEDRRALRETTVPTSDADVRAALRAISEPVTLFGEQQVTVHCYAQNMFHAEHSHIRRCTTVCLQATVCTAKEYHFHAWSVMVQMERRARLRKIMATMDDEDERKAALPGELVRTSDTSLSMCAHACRLITASLSCQSEAGQGFMSV